MPGVKDFDVGGFIQEVLGDTEIPKEQREAVEAVLKQDAVRDRLADRALKQADYSRQTQALQQKQKEYEEAERRIQEWYQQELAAFAESSTQLDEARRELNRMKQGHPSDNGDSPVNPAVPAFADGEYVDRKVFSDQLNKLQDSGARLMADFASLSVSHQREFNEILDTQGVLDKAFQEKKTVRAAYNEMVASRRHEAAEAQRKAEIEAAREEGRKAALTEMKLPTFAVPQGDPHPLSAREKLGEGVQLPAWKRGVENLQKYIELAKQA